MRFDRSVKAILLAIAIFLGMIALRPLVDPAGLVMAQAARFEHVQIVSPLFLYKGNQGILALDQRNANIWFIPKVNEVYQAPVFVMRLPFDKLDQAPH